jgi:septum formation protein
LEIILASKSPRRQELLRQIGVRFQVVPSDITEELTPGAPPETVAVRLASAKARDVSASHPDRIVLGADTIVVAGGEMLGKPENAADARRMLKSLSGRGHEVITGVALVRRSTGQEVSGFERTTVYFHSLADEEIERYIATGEPADKAGAYAIQGRAALLISGIAGDYSNVVGLPIPLVGKLLQQFGVQIL